MGADSSKPASSAGEHVFTSSSPTSFSQQVVDGLQTSPETDKSRASDKELHIQRRVQSELKRLEAEQDKRLSELQELLKEKDPPPSDTASSTSSTTATLKEKIQQSTASIASTLTGQSQDSKKELDREGVQKEIEKLRAKLSKRKLKEEIVNDKQVEKSRSAVVECLRLNDRRPLDCWKEVEAFQQEVGRLEGQFLGKVLE